MGDTILDFLNSNKFRYLVIELYDGGFLRKTRVFPATIEGMIEAVKYLLSLKGKAKNTIIIIFKILSARGGKYPLDDYRKVKWYYLP